MDRVSYIWHDREFRTDIVTGPSQQRRRCHDLLERRLVAERPAISVVYMFVTIDAKKNMHIVLPHEHGALFVYESSVCSDIKPD